ncbi:hypothetical protein Barb4_02691 [Bacteroidales bacterium Barb4]|nr:hypothetical protein Barb4_02691 [Bacteroidales bacterium Barb4]
MTEELYTPKKQRAALTAKVMRRLSVSGRLSIADSGALPMVRDIAIMANPMLKACPTRRMVPVVADAKPYSLFSTELMMTLVFGEEKMPKPRPMSARTVKM